MASEPFVIERVYDAPVKTVWKAITDEQAIKQWFMEFEQFEPRVGCEFQFTAQDKGFTYVHHCRVTEVVPEERLAYSWRYEGYEGDSLVTFELFPEGNKTRIKLTHAGLETFPKLPSFARENFVAGWTSLIGDLLKTYVEKQGCAMNDFIQVTDAERQAREVVSSRVFDAPRELVFGAFSDPRQLAIWWGPDGFTNTIAVFDLRVNGDWHLTMHGPDGTDYPNESVFLEVTPPQRIVYLHLRPMHRFQMTMEFATRDEQTEQTELTWRMLFDSDAECERVRAFVVPAIEQNFDRLAAHLKTMSAT